MLDQQQGQLWDAGRVIIKGRRGRKITCTCGQCRVCRARLYYHGVRHKRELKPERLGPLNKEGYRLVYLHREDPLLTMSKGRGKERGVLEHRLVMARHLGRPLNQDELVHHRNGIKTDNRIENLELWTRSHPNGQRVEDVLAWAHEFIARYDPRFLVP